MGPVLRALIGAVAALAATPAFAEDWQSAVVIHPTVVAGVDVSSIVVDGSRRRATMVFAWRESQGNAKNYDYAVQPTEFDCGNSTFTQLSVTAYRIDGTVSGRIGDQPAKPAPPGTLIGDVAAFVCGDLRRPANITDVHTFALVARNVLSGPAPSP